MGVILLNRLEQAQFAGVTTIEDFQFQIEHALDLVDADLALFVDAAEKHQDVGIAFLEVFAEGARSKPSSHALEPADVLDVYVKSQGRSPPPCFVLAVRGEDFSVREGLSAGASVRLEETWLLLKDLCAAPDVARWRETARQLGERETKPSTK
ncbi:MAG: homospermidine synthase [Alphaproteobacteria bacterium]|nr:homospermidine synthase [Alphaproteobacteria bacterium]